MLKALKQTFFPKKCIACHAVLWQKEQHLCWHCHATLPCIRHNQFLQKTTRQLFLGQVAIEDSLTLFSFEKNSGIQKVIHQLKYHHQGQLSAQLAKWFLAHKTTADTDFFKNIDFIVPVPITRQKERKRGYNQLDGFARHIAAYFGTTYLKDLLRCKPKKTQTKKTKKERFLNVKGVFYINKNLIKKVMNKKILLIDDVITTGATALHCAKVLKDIKNTDLKLLFIAKKSYD